MYYGIKDLFCIISYSALFADNLVSLFIFKMPGHIKNIIKSYLESLVSWLYKWRLKMNASKCCFTIFSKSGNGFHNLDLFLTLNGNLIIPIQYSWASYLMRFKPQDQSAKKIKHPQNIFT